MWRTVLIHGTRGPIQVTFEKISCQQSGPLHQRRSRNNFDGDVFLSYDGPKSNCPLFCVENGVLVLRGLRLSHQSSGVDLWGGNAVIHVEARNGLAQVSVEGCDITSKSGRGIAISNGGKLTVNQSSIHSCAATGVYISDSNSTARIASTDIVFNGIGGQRLARGHSGVCLENNGTVSIRDCNISLNSGSGISIINTEVWRLNLSDSDVIGNGAKPLDFPNADADVLSSSIPALIRNGNRLDDSGPTRPRSALPHTWFLTAQQAVFEEFIDM